MNRRTIFLCAVLSALVAPLARGVEAPPRDQLGREVKLRIVVDKVMQPEAAWKTEEWMIEESARAGFNVYSPRIGFDDLSAVRQVTAWCEQHGIYHMPWMRGSLTAPNGPEAEGKRLVWDNGLEQPLWSPNADEFWDWTEKYIVEYAKMSAENRHLMGVFLDYENYAPGRTGNLYSLRTTTSSSGNSPEPGGSTCPNSMGPRANPGSTSRACTRRSRRSRSPTGANGAATCASASMSTTPRSSSAFTPRLARRS